jgi:hypothetical protein
MSEKEVFTQEELKKTESGIEYSEHKFERNDGVESTVKLFKSINPSRLEEEEETFEEFRIRRALGKRYVNRAKKGIVMWNPYPFGKGTKGLSMNAKNIEVMKALMEQQRKQEEIKKEEV